MMAKQKGDHSVVSTLEDELVSDVKLWIPTGFPDLDRAFGGGWAVGRLSEVFGPEGAGKSALTHCAVRSCQSIGGLPIYVDWENALESDKMDQLGIRPDGIVYIKPQSVEAAWDLVWKAIEMVGKLPDGERPTCILVVWDSIAASISRKEAEDKDGDAHTNFEVAKAMSKACRKAYLIAPQVNAHFLFVNQERTQIGGFAGGFGGPPKTTPGGDAVKYACSLRVRCARLATLKNGDEASGYEIKVTTRKNKCAPPHRTGSYILDFKYGPSPELTMLTDFIRSKVLKLAKSPSGPVKRKESELDDDGVPKPKTKRYEAPWHSAPFAESEWMGLMADPGFRAGATAAYSAWVESRRSQGADAEAASEPND